MSEQVIWLFGRGLSIGCGLDWDVPTEWNNRERSQKIEMIRAELQRQMDLPTVRTQGISDFLGFLSEQTSEGWRHRFITTNWDFLLQREISQILRPGDTRPSWLAESHVFHLNGTVEHLPGAVGRTDFLLVEDSYDLRKPTLEGQKAFDHMVKGKNFVVVGMSFECSVDRFLLHLLGRVQNDWPAGESNWVVVNPNGKDLNTLCNRIQDELPCATVVRVRCTLDEWREQEFPELAAWGVFAG